MKIVLSNLSDALVVVYFILFYFTLMVLKKHIPLFCNIKKSKQYFEAEHSTFHCFVILKNQNSILKLTGKLSLPTHRA